MITLTTPIQIKNTIGSDATIAYDKLVASSTTINHLSGVIDVQLRLTSTSSPSARTLTGTMRITPGSALLEVEGQQFSVQRQQSLTGGQVTAANTLGTDLHADIENGMITLGVSAGVRSNGT